MLSPVTGITVNRDLYMVCWVPCQWPFAAHKTLRILMNIMKSRWNQVRKSYGNILCSYFGVHVSCFVFALWVCTKFVKVHTKCHMMYQYCSAFQRYMDRKHLCAVHCEANIRSLVVAYCRHATLCCYMCVVQIDPRMQVRCTAWHPGIRAQSGGYAFVFYKSDAKPCSRDYCEQGLAYTKVYTIFNNNTESRWNKAC